MIFRMVQNFHRFFFRFVAMHTFDRHTDRRNDRQTEFSSLNRVCIPCSAVKVFFNIASTVHNPLQEYHHHHHQLVHTLQLKSWDIQYLNNISAVGCGDEIERHSVLLCKIKRLFRHLNVDWTQNHTTNKQDLNQTALV